MANRLAAETSPYLLQHRHNPVDWYPWGPEALERARAEDRPILLSIGYSACHWCHVMERECFEDEAIAAQMNARFVCVKVDREERPDLDNLYQTVVQLQRRSGGWPLTVFLLPDGRPFFSGTYFPPAPRHGLPGFPDVLEQIDRAYRTRRDEVEAAGSAFTDAIVRVQAPSGGALPTDALTDAGRALLARIDAQHGGFGDAPKFPSVPALDLLWRFSQAGGPADDAELTADRATAAEAVAFTLIQTVRGGVYDHVAGGWHRYATDRAWHVPHFEKMLYDQALLVPLCVEVAERRGVPELRQAAERAAAWVVGEMRSPEGLFHAATDADSEGEEGRYFVWTRAEVADALRAAGLGDRVDAFCAAYDVTERGNWEGTNILRLLRPLAASAEEAGVLPQALDTARAVLRQVRAGRVAPLRDTKAIVSWNALMIRALVRADIDGALLAHAEAAADAVHALLTEPDGTLLHQRCLGRSAGAALLDDHAALGLACLALHEATGRARWLDRALALAIAIEARFEGDGAYFQTPDDAEGLVTRPRDAHDSAVPSGTGLAVALMLRLHAHTDEPRWTAAAERTLHACAGQLDNAFGAASLIAALDLWERGPTEVVVAADADGALARMARRVAGPDTVVLRVESLPDGHPATHGRRVAEPTAWVCRGQTCSLPVHTPDALRGALGVNGGLPLAAGPAPR